MAIELRLLGPLEILDGESVLAIAGEKARALLIVLALHTDEVVSSDELVEALWEGHPPATVTATLQMHVAKLRKTLGRDAIVTEPPGYRLALPSEAIDARRFERRLAAGRAALRAGDSERAKRLLSEALALWRGQALADVAYADFAQADRRRLEELRLEALEERIEADLARGREEELASELGALVPEHPLRERLRGQLMLALYRSGRQAEALEVYQDARSALVDELGIDPSPELQALQRRILNQDPALTPESSEGTGSRLPVPATPLVGRREELEKLALLLTSSEVRLVTLTGAGGIGKTRLALELAHRADTELPGGARFLSLATLNDPELVLPQIAGACGVSEGGGKPLAEKLARALAEPILVVLDNFEQVVDAAGAVASLIATAPALRVLVTSRERLHVRGEREIVLAPLELEEAIELFLARAEDAGMVLDRTPVVYELCSRLDLLPLALELAAARLKLLSPAQILERLSERLDLLKGGRDADPRQQTLRSTIEWSYELLSAEERELFRRLSIFAGGCVLAAAEEVCGASLDTLQSLVEKSLLGFSNDRYWMLETIRQYAADRLEESDEELRGRHTNWCLTFAGEADTHLRRPEQLVWLSRLDEEIENMRAAFLACVSSENGAAAVRLAASMNWYLERRGRVRESRDQLTASLALPSSDQQARIEALERLAHALSELGEPDAARDAASEQLRLAQKLGDERAIASAYQRLGSVTADPRLLEQAADLAYRTGDADMHGRAVINLGLLALAEGRDVDALAHLLEACELGKTLGNRHGLGVAQAGISEALFHLGRIDEAEAQLSVAAEALRQVGDVVGLVGCVDIAAAIAYARGDLDATARWVAASDSKRLEIGLDLIDARVRGPVDAALSVRTGPSGGADRLSLDFATAVADIASLRRPGPTDTDAGRDRKHV